MRHFTLSWGVILSFGVPGKLYGARRKEYCNYGQDDRKKHARGE